jgi:hypothetical protein
MLGVPKSLLGYDLHVIVVFLALGVMMKGTWMVSCAFSIELSSSLEWIAEGSIMNLDREVVVIGGL